MNSDKIYPTMVIRSQAEAIELLEKENKELKERVAYLERSNNRREDEIISLRDELIPTIKEEFKYGLMFSNLRAGKGFASELIQENKELKELYRSTCKHLFDIGNDELARYFQAQIDENNTFTVGDK